MKMKGKEEVGMKKFFLGWWCGGLFIIGVANLNHSNAFILIIIFDHFHVMRI